MMLRAYIIILFLFYSCITSNGKIHAQGTFRGTLIDSVMSIPMAGVNVYNRTTEKGTTSNETGWFSISAKPGDSIFVSHLAFQNMLLVVEEEDLEGETEIYLLPANYMGEEILVTGKNENFLAKNTDLGHISRKEAESIPSLFGNKDYIKSLQLTPGIQSVSEGNQGIYVRGGAPGQNLISLDNMPLFNPSHLLGFFSTFNGNIIESAEVYKGTAPASYGDRISSFINMNVDGSSSPFGGNLNLNPLMTSIDVHAPLLNENVNILFSARQSYFTGFKKTFIKPFIEMPVGLNNMAYDFNDMYGRFQFRPFHHTTITVSGFQSADDYSIANNEFNFINEMDWKNQAFKVSSLSNIGTDIYIFQQIGISDYKFGLNTNFQDYQFALDTRIEQKYWRFRLNKKMGSHFLEAGGEVNKYETLPASMSIELDDYLLSNEEEIHNREFAIYLNDQFKMGEKWELNAGLRTTIYQLTGPYYKNVQNLPGDSDGATVFQKSGTVLTRLIPQPRVMVKHSLDGHRFLSLGLSGNTQNIHLLTIGSVSLPLDIWIPSTTYLEPEYAWQGSLSYHQDFSRTGLSAEMSIYGKYMTNQVELKSSIINYREKGGFEELITSGTGYAYGIETRVKKETGKLTGWLAYTLSRSMRKFPELSKEPFPYKYDRIHDMSIVSAYQVNKQMQISSTFVYATGNSMTMPVGRYLYQEKIVNIYSNINGYRIRDYHRMDIALKYKMKNKIYNYFNIEFDVSIYNVYNRMNTFYITFISEGNLEDNEFLVSKEEISLYPILPSVGLNIRF